MDGGDAQLYLPPGFRFHPTDDELVNHYLCRRCAGLPIAVPIIAEIDLYKFNPWQLPGMALYGEREWYFFSPRDRKYPNGSRPNRAAGSGYWKATGADKPIGSPKAVAIKKALVFYSGKAPKGEKSNWIMHEYRLAGVDRSARRKSQSLRLDDWVLCRIYNKKGGSEKLIGADRKLAGLKPNLNRASPAPVWVDQKPQIVQQMSSKLSIPPHVPMPVSDLLYLDPSESLPRLHADSSCSEHVVSPEFSTCDTGGGRGVEVQSQPRWRPPTEWEKTFENSAAAINNNNGESNTVAGFPPLSPAVNGFRDPFQDIMMYLQKPF